MWVFGGSSAETLKANRSIRSMRNRRAPRARPAVRARVPAQIDDKRFINAWVDALAIAHRYGLS
jgi:hypothetical protein